MTPKSASTLAFAALLANLAFVATGCDAFGGDSSSPASSDPQQQDAPARDDAAPAATPTAPPVVGAASTSELTDALGVFVSPAGSDSADGNHLRPVATIAAGIDLAKRASKRVYVCTGTFHEAITVADSISIIGGLDCTNNEWRVGGNRTRVESPTSPALRAANITAATRIDGLELIAPDATTPSGSSFGLIADHASALVIAHTKITAGSGMKGEDGVDGIQLANSPTVNGAPSLTAGPCDFDTCAATSAGLSSKGLTPGGTNVCIGAPGHEAQPGGAAGSGGVYEIFNDVAGWQFRVAHANPLNASSTGVTNRTSAPGAAGVDGINATAIGVFSAEGYQPASGAAGTDGSSGLGGAGGSGTTPDVDVNPNTLALSSLTRGPRGASGGAGGCAGLAGAPGTGGGASVAALLIESAVTFDAAELASAHGGDAGLGAFGSLPTVGGQPNNAEVHTHPALFGKPGGHGGAAGVSGNGANGPSIGIAHVGAKPDVRGDTVITPGSGGAAVGARSRTDAFGTTKTVGATPAGVSAPILPL